MDHIFATYKTKIHDYDLVIFHVFIIIKFCLLLWKIKKSLLYNWQVFFPVHHVNHYYVVCYNLKNSSIDILDNRASERPIKNLYGQPLIVLVKIPKNCFCSCVFRCCFTRIRHTLKSCLQNSQQKHFVKYLQTQNHYKFGDISKLVPQRLKMRWQTKENGIDCGVFAMRHMETYFGGGSRNWDAKFAPESVIFWMTC